MNIQEMWNSYKIRKQDFLYMYIAYHHFRTKGWVVRFSNVFGADFGKSSEIFCEESAAVYVSRLR